MNRPDVEAPGALAEATGRAEQKQDQNVNCGVLPHAEQLADALRKKHATLQAKLALRGFELRQLDCGAWLITRWNLTRELATLDDVEAFSKQVGAA